MNVETKKTGNYFPVPVDLLQNSQLTPIQFKIAAAYCYFYNPHITRNENFHPKYSDIAQKTALSIDTIKKQAPQLFKKLQKYFIKRNRLYGKGYEYEFVMYLKKSVETVVTAPVDSRENLIGDTNYSEDDLKKMFYLQKLNFPRKKLEGLLPYSLLEIKARIEYILRQREKKGIGNYKDPNGRIARINWGYVKKCFEEQWNIPELRNLSKKDKIQLANSLDARVNGLLDGLTKKMSVVKGDAA